MDMLDKDIKILREFTESNCCLYSQEEIIEATKNILSELEKYKMFSKIYEEDSSNYRQEVQRQSGRIVELGNDLETWKKIAEFFGKSLINISGEKTSLEELIDWAKSEVLKNE